MERQMQIKESKEEINGFTLVKNTEEMAILKVMVKMPWEIAQHPYLSSDYEYITITKEEKNDFTIVKEDGTTLSFSDNTILDASFDKLRNKILDTLKKYGIVINVQTMELPQKMEIYYYSDYKKWLVNLSFDGVFPKQSIWLAEPKDENEVCEAIEEIYGIKFKPLTHGYAQTGIDIWKAERDNSHELVTSYKKD